MAWTYAASGGECTQRDSTTISRLSPLETRCDAKVCRSSGRRQARMPVLRNAEAQNFLRVKDKASPISLSVAQAGELGRALLAVSAVSSSAALQFEGTRIDNSAT